MVHLSPNIVGTSGELVFSVGFKSISWQVSTEIVVSIKLFLEITHPGLNHDYHFLQVLLIVGRTGSDLT